MSDQRRREEKELRELTSLLLGTPGRPTREARGAPAQPDRHPAVILVSATGGEAAATALAAALGALPASGPLSALVRLADKSVPGPSLRQEELLRLEQSPGRLIALVPPSQSVLLRAAALAASRAVIWTGSDEAEWPLAGTLVGELLAGTPDLPVALLTPPERAIRLPPAAAAVSQPGWTWAPGRILPAPLERFVAGASPGPVPLSWALTGLSVFRDASRTMRKRTVP